MQKKANNTKVLKRHSIYYNPILQVGNMSVQYKLANLIDMGSKKETVQKVTFHTIDGDGSLLTLKFSTQLINMSILLNEGSVIVLYIFQTVVFPMDANHKVIKAVYLCL